MPNAFDPPSGFLATANSRVTSDKSKYPITNNWADPYRAERIYKLLQGRDQLKPADMLATQTDIYSEMDQELGHRLSYAIDHTTNADDQLRKAADLMRSWDGRLTTDSAAASLVTQTRYALRIMLLEPKLGNEDAENYEWSESNFAEEEIVMHANPAWLPPAYKDWDAFLADAVRRGMIQGHATADVTKWTYGSWHVVDIEHPLSGFLPYISRIAGTGPQPLSGDTTTVKQVGRTFGPSQRFTMDWSNIDGSTEDIVLGESGNPLQPLLPRSVGRLLQRPHLCASVHPRRRLRATRSTPSDSSHERSTGIGNRDRKRALGAPGLASETWEFEWLAPFPRSCHHLPRRIHRHFPRPHLQNFLRTRLRFPSRLVARCASQLETWPLLSALGAQS